MFPTITQIKAKMSLCLIKHHTTKSYVLVKTQLHAFLTSALDGVFSFTLRPPLTQRKQRPVPTE